MPPASDAMKSILCRTAWDITIEVVPFFLLSNSLPLPIVARTWQLPSKREDDSWRDQSFLLTEQDEDMDEEISSDEDLSSKTPSIKGRGGGNPDQFHSPRGSGQKGYFSLDYVARGETLKLCGINLRQPLYLQVQQRLNILDENDEAEFSWSKPLQINLSRLRTGINPKGQFSLPKMPLDLGDSCSLLVDVSIEREIRMPICTIYAPYFITNKTGSKLEYKVKVSSTKVS